MTSITIELPDDLAQQAKQAGLLKSDEISKWLLFLLSQKQLGSDLFEMADRINQSATDLTPDEVNREVRLARNKHHNKN